MFSTKVIHFKAVNHVPRVAFTIKASVAISIFTGIPNSDIRILTLSIEVGQIDKNGN